MSGLALHTDLSALNKVAARMTRLTRSERHQLLENAGAVMESSARRRIESDKRSPDDLPWPDWSPAYAETRHSGQSLLSAEGGLLDSLRAEVRGEEVEVGSNLVYAAVHQFGGAEVGMAIPARPYLGVSPADKTEILSVVDDWADALLGDLK